MFDEIEKAEVNARSFDHCSSSGAPTSQSYNPYSTNTILIGFLKAMNKAMRVSSGKEALTLLVVSDRISEDLSKNNQFADSLYFSRLVVREWIPQVVESPHLEFRSFIYDKKINAVSQYLFEKVSFPLFVHPFTRFIPLLSSPPSCIIVAATFDFLSFKAFL